MSEVRRSARQSAAAKRDFVEVGKPCKEPVPGPFYEPTPEEIQKLQEMEQQMQDETFLTSVTPKEVKDDSCKTFIFREEGHTLGNALRVIISHYPETAFCGHTIPHPAEDEMHLRIQTAGGVSAVDLLKKGLKDLEMICDHTEELYMSKVAEFTKLNPVAKIKKETSRPIFTPPAAPPPRPQ